MSEQRYCSSCLSFRVAETGKMVQTATKNIKRFKCAVCLSRMVKPNKELHVPRTHKNS
jgi:hypothetical protein